MSRGECPTPREACPYYDRTPPPELRGQEFGCFSDLDHLVPQRLAKGLGKTSLIRQYIYHPVNLSQTCRWEHEMKNKQGDRLLPSEEVMLQEIAEYEANNGS